MKQLAQTGIFKVRPTAWEIYAAVSGAVSVSMTFLVLEELDEGNVWASWDEFEDHQVYGSWWVIKKDGTVNTGAVDQLVECLGWNGNLTSVGGEPPQKIVQITVKDETWEGVTRYKASWMNPEDFTGGGGDYGVDEAGAKALQARFGSLLRAAAGSAKPKAEPKKAAKKAPAKKKAGPKGAGNPGEDIQGGGAPAADDEIPFA